MDSICVMAVLIGLVLGLVAGFNDGYDGVPLNSLRRLRGMIFYPTMLAVGGMLLWAILHMTAGLGSLITATAVLLVVAYAPKLAYRLGVAAAKKSPNPIKR